MKKTLLTAFIFVTLSLVSFAQNSTPLTKYTSVPDSQNKKSTNVLELSMGIGNGAFSTHNNTANATGQSNQIIYTPAVVYRLKNGLSFGATAYLSSDTANNSALYQTGLLAAYDYIGKDVNAGLAYTRFLTDKNKYNSKSLFQNDIYAYVKKANGALQPGLSLGFDNGNYKQVTIASGVLKRPLNPRGDTTITGKDSTSNKTSYFSVSASVEHNFKFYNLFSASDDIEFVPSLSINWATDNLTQTHNNKIFTKKIFSKRQKVEANEKFQLQSLAASYEVNYEAGSFFFQHSLYVDYYLPATTNNRWSAIFSFTVGISF